MEKLVTKLLKLIAGIGMVLFGVLLGTGIFVSRKLSLYEETIHVVKDHWIAAILALTMTVVIFYGIYAWGEKINYNYLRIFAGLIAIIWTGIIIFIALEAKFQPVADQEYVCIVLQNLFYRDYTELKSYWYYNAFPYQLGVGAIYLLPSWIAGNCSVTTLQCFQAVCLGVSIYIGNEIVWKLFHRECVCCYYLIITACFVPMHLYALFVYGESIGICFLYLALLCLLTAEQGKMVLWKKVLCYVAMTLCMIVSYTAREALLIVWVAVLGIQLLHNIHTGKKTVVITLLCVFLMLAGQKAIIGWVEKQAGIEQADGVPVTSVIAMGFQDDDPNHTGKGSYNAYEIHLYFENGFDSAKCNELSIKDIKRSVVGWLRAPDEAVKFFWEKALNQWLEPSFGAMTFTSNMEPQKKWIQNWYSDRGYDATHEFLNQVQNVIYLGVFLYFVALFLRRREEWEYLPGLILVGEFLFSLLWEAKSRYVYPYITIAIFAMAMGYYYLMQYIYTLIHKTEHRKESKTDHREDVA